MAEVVDLSAVPYGIDNEFATENKYANRKLYNPLSDDFTFSWGGQEYVLKARQNTILPEFLAIHGAKYLAEKMLDIKFPIKDKREPQLKYNFGDVKKQMHNLLDQEEEQDMVVVPVKSSRGAEGDPDFIPTESNRIIDMAMPIVSEKIK